MRRIVPLAAGLVLLGLAGCSKGEAASSATTAAPTTSAPPKSGVAKGASTMKPNFNPAANPEAILGSKGK